MCEYIICKFMYVRIFYVYICHVTRAVNGSKNIFSNLYENEDANCEKGLTFGRNLGILYEIERREKKSDEEERGEKGEGEKGERKRERERESERERQQRACERVGD